MPDTAHIISTTVHTVSNPEAPGGGADGADAVLGVAPPAACPVKDPGFLAGASGPAGTVAAAGKSGRKVWAHVLAALGADQATVLPTVRERAGTCLHLEAMKEVTGRAA